MIKIICVGKLKEKASSELVNEYTKRLSAYTKFSIIEVADEKTLDNASLKQMEIIKDKEAQRVLEKIKVDDYVILLDLHGKEWSSAQFASQLDSLFTNGQSNICFVIGGSLGLGENLINRANQRLKISNMTFPHQICRILLVEQIYRAFTIINNTPYHK